MRATPLAEAKGLFAVGSREYRQEWRWSVRAGVSEWWEEETDPCC